MNVEFTPLIAMELAEIRQLPATPTTLVALLNRASHLKTLDPIRAFAIAAEAMQRAHHLNEPQQEARARAISAYAAAQVEQDEISHLYGEQALTEGSRWDDYITMGYACLGIGQYLINQFRYDDALEIGLHGYDLLGLAGDHAAQANITFIVMGAYSRLGNREQAEAYTFRAIEQYQELQNVGGESVQLNNLAMHFFWMGEYDRARQYGDQAVALFRQAQQQGQPFDFAFVQPGIMHTLAEIAIAQNDLVGA
jgi:tetratricopeptide (TPR) repeat protein